ncbi:MAG: cysteine desulfurase [Polyangiaceae bacterium]|nr:cysteine desulfurase [Polyangiaceae bacterium]
MGKSRQIYLDWNATTPPLAEVLDAMRDAALRAWGNPSSIHTHGRAARAIVEDARAAVGALCGADARDVVFTSGATEANNLAIRSAFGPSPLRERNGRERWLVTSRLEHPSVTRVAEALEAEGKATVRWVRVHGSGTLDLDDLAHTLSDGQERIGLVTAQAVNHETGVVQPLDEIATLARSHGARIHVDAVQAWGKIRFQQLESGLGFDPSALPWDTVSLAGHKIRGPKGIGALVARPGLALEPVLVGGAQEKGLRPGTVDPALATGLAVAARRAQISPVRWSEIAALRDAFESALLAMLARDPARAPRAIGASARRVSHVSTLVWPGWVGAELVAALDLEGVSVSSGSACSAGTVEPSPVVLAMLGPADASSSVRVSLGDETTMDDIERAIKAFHRVVTR